MSDIDDEPDRYDLEEKCPQCKGKCWYADFLLRRDCELCEGTGVNLQKAGYYNQPESD